MMRMPRLLLALAGPLLLTSCLLTPGKFTSSLDIRKDRSFTFAYAGEVIALEEGSSRTSCSEGDERPECTPKAQAEAKAKKLAEQETKLREIAGVLSKEPGYRSVEYLGQRKFRVDYAISGRLDRSFAYPFNTDAAAIMPWIAIELRKDGTARVKAPAFGEGMDNQTTGMLNPMDEAAKQRDGTFTFTTDAEIVMQNEESGIADAGGGAKRVVWRVTPTSQTVPTAVVRFRD